MSPEEGDAAEIMEELNAEIEVDQLLDTIEWDYSAFHLTMHCFICKMKSEHLQLNEHNDAAWLTKDTLGSVKWLPADLTILEKIETHINTLN